MTEEMRLEMFNTAPKISADPRSSAWAAALAAVGLLVAIQSFFIFRPALWIDEVFSIYYAQKPLSAIWGADWRLEPTPPLYYTVLAAWQKLGAVSEPAFRCLSVLFSAGTIFFIVLLGGELRSVRAGFYAALLWLTLPLVIEYSIEIRAYALLICEISFLLWWFARLLRRAPAQEPRNFARDAAPLGIAGVLIGYTHITGIFAFVAVTTCLAAALVLFRRRDLLLVWAVVNVAVGLALLPQVAASLAVVRENQFTLNWLPPISVGIVRWALRNLVTGASDMKGGWLVASVFVWAVAIGGALYVARRDGRVMAICVLVPLIGLSGLIIVSLRSPALLPRTVLWLSVPMVILVGVALSELQSRIAAPVLGALACLGAANTIDDMSVRARSRDDAQALRTLTAKSHPTDIVVQVNGENACLMQFYGAPMSQFRLLNLGPDQAFKRRQAVDLSCNAPPSVDADAIAQHLRTGAAVWLVSPSNSDFRRWRDIETVEDHVRGLAREAVRVDGSAFSLVKLCPVNDPANASCSAP